MGKETWPSPLPKRGSPAWKNAHMKDRDEREAERRTLRYLQTWCPCWFQDGECIFGHYWDARIQRWRDARRGVPWPDGLEPAQWVEPQNCPPPESLLVTVTEW